MRTLVAIAAATVLYALLVCAGVVTIGWTGDWTYGLHPGPPARYGNVPLAALAAVPLVAVVGIGARRSASGRWAAGLLVAGFVSLVGLILPSRTSLGEPGFVAYLDWSGGFFADARRLRDEPDAISRYESFLPRLSIHGRSHPPGPMAVHRWMLNAFDRRRELGASIHAVTVTWGDLGEVPTPVVGMTKGPWMAPPEPWEQAACHVTAWLVLAFAVSAAVPIYLLGARLRDPAVGLTGAALYLAAPAISFFEPMMDLAYPVFTAWGLYFFSRGFGAPRAWAWWAASGAAFGLGLFFSYCQLAALPMLAIWWMAEWRAGRRVVYPWAAWAVGAVAAAVALLPTGHNVAIDMAGFLERLGSHGADWTSWAGGAGAPAERPYARWVALNLVEFLSFLGIPTAIGLVMAVRGRAPMVVAVVGGLLVLDLAGINRSEVARIWIFMMPAAAVGAATVLSRFPAAATALVWLQALAFKLTLTTNNIVN